MPRTTTASAPPRRSPRKRARLTSDNATAQTPEVVPATSSTSRNTASKKQLRGRRGGLKDMPNMPIDILLEIFSHLLPIDLLNLARTSKSCRALLMSRSSGSLWRASRQLVDGLPDCPPHLSEPAYANLVFSNHCHNCLKSHTQSIIWEFGVRYCNSCKRSLSVRWLDDHPHANRLSEHLSKLRPLLNRAELFGKKHLYYHSPQIEEVMSAWEELHDEEEKWSQYEQDQLQKKKAVQVHAAACAAWAADRAQARAEELDVVRQRRLEFIINKLRSMGWAEEMLKLRPGYYPLADHHHVRVAKELTERAWEKIRDELSTYMQHVQTARLTRERSAAIRSRLQVLECVIDRLRNDEGRSSMTESHPKFPDYALMPEFRALIEGPTHAPLDKQAFARAIVRIPDLDGVWLAQRAYLLDDMLRRAMGLVPEGMVKPHGLMNTYIFDLAIALVECRRCQERMPLTMAIPHRCAHSPSTYWFLDFDLEEHAEDDYMRDLRYVARGVRPWDMNCFRVPDLEQVRGVLRACGKDPETTTKKEMHDEDIWVAVKDILVDGKRKVMKWDAAVYAGHLDSTVRASGWQFELLSEEDKRRAKEQEENDEDSLIPALMGNGTKYWCCGLCDQLPAGSSNNVILDHLGVKHGEWDDDAEAHRFLHPDIHFLAASKSVLLPLA